MKRDRWTHTDEAELQRLTKRKQELNAKSFAPLVELCQRELADEKTCQQK